MHKALKNILFLKGIDVGAGVIDQDYRGNVGIILFNFGDEDFKVEKEAAIIDEDVNSEDAKSVDDKGSNS